MAIPQEAIDINEERLVIVQKIEDLKVKARALKKRYDEIVETANLQHKLGGLSEQDKERLRALLDE